MKANGSRTTILQIVPQLDTGGAELSAIEIGEAVARAGGRSLIATEGGRLEATAIAQGAEIVHMPVATKNPARIYANARRLAELARENDVSVIHARSRAPAWSALLAARWSAIPFVTTYHGAYNERGPLKRFYNSVMVRSQRVIANSQFTADLIATRYNTPWERIRIIYRGVEPGFDITHVTPERIAAVRERWGGAGAKRVVLHAARLTGWKGQSVLIGAAGLLRERGLLDDTLIILAGDAQGRDDYERRLKQEIAALKLDEVVRLVGHEADIAAAFAAAYVGVVASTEPEAFGRTAAEAQALGCPVIATRLGAPPETVLAEPDVSSGETTGWLVPPDDKAALADSLAAALSLSTEARTSIGRRAARHVHEHFTAEVMKQKTLKVYDELIDNCLEKGFLRASAATITSGLS